MKPEACSRDGRSYYWSAERKGERKASQEVAQEVAQDVVVEAPAVECSGRRCGGLRSLLVRGGDEGKNGTCVGIVYTAFHLKYSTYVVQLYVQKRLC